MSDLVTAVEDVLDRFNDVDRESNVKAAEVVDGNIDVDGYSWKDVAYCIVDNGSDRNLQRYTTLDRGEFRELQRELVEVFYNER